MELEPARKNRPICSVPAPISTRQRGSSGNGVIVAESYFYPYDGKTPHDIASVTKPITATLIGLAIAQGKIDSVRQPVHRAALMLEINFSRPVASAAEAVKELRPLRGRSKTRSEGNP